MAVADRYSAVLTPFASVIDLMPRHYVAGRMAADLTVEGRLIHELSLAQVKASHYRPFGRYGHLSRRPLPTTRCSVLPADVCAVCRLCRPS